MSNARDEPPWLHWARELQALAQTGLTFTQDPYDRERYQRLQGLAWEMFSAQSGQPPAVIADLFGEQRGYATPKVEVRGAVFDAAGRILMVRETLDGGRWTLPGGWAEVNLTPQENLLKEIREESGYEARVRKLAAVWEHVRQGHPPAAFACVKLFFVCDLAGGAARTSIETSEVGWFGREEIPADLSVRRVLPAQIARMFEHAAQAHLPTDYN